MTFNLAEDTHIRAKTKAVSVEKGVSMIKKVIKHYYLRKEKASHTLESKLLQTRSTKLLFKSLGYSRRLILRRLPL